MVISQYRSRLKSTGSRYRALRKKKQFEAGNLPALPKVAPRKTRMISTLGGNYKVILTQADVANVLDQKTKKYHKARIINVIDNPANKHYVRRNILTKGSIISTEKGKARVTNRPGQEGQVNAVLIA